MIKGTAEELNAMVENFQCPEHPDVGLTVAQHPQEGLVIRCGAGHYPEEVKRLPTRMEQYKRGEIQVVDSSFNLLPRADLETGEVLSPEQRQALVDYAKRYGLDAYRGHVVVMHGKPYIGLDGYLYHAYRNNIPYSLTGRILTADELTAMGYQAGDLGYRAHLILTQNGQEFEGYGFVTKAEREEMSPKHPDRHRSPVVANHPWVLCVKRADWQALRRAFPIGEEEKSAGDQA